MVYIMLSLSFKCSAVQIEYDIIYSYKGYKVALCCISLHYFMYTPYALHYPQSEPPVYLVEIQGLLWLSLYAVSWGLVLWSHQLSFHGALSGESHYKKYVSYFNLPAST
jgi:hypothetical protein